jgi:hypothetical protein
MSVGSAGQITRVQRKWVHLVIQGQHERRPVRCQTSESRRAIPSRLHEGSCTLNVPSAALQARPKLDCSKALVLWTKLSTIVSKGGSRLFACYGNMLPQRVLTVLNPKEKTWSSISRAPGHPGHFTPASSTAQGATSIPSNHASSPSCPWSGPFDKSSL